MASEQQVLIRLYVCLPWSFNHPRASTLITTTYREVREAGEEMESLALLGFGWGRNIN
jgi:hypothetical protein